MRKGIEGLASIVQQNFKWVMRQTRGFENEFTTVQMADNVYVSLENVSEIEAIISYQKRP